MMALLERVATLLRANLNELIDRAENPEIMLKQVILDMQNQLMQVKTQVAMALADQHLLNRKVIEHEQAEAEWLRKAELGIGVKQEDLARAAVERAVSHRETAASFRQQLGDQSAQVEHLKSALQQLERKLGEARVKREVLTARHRRARALSKATEARSAVNASPAAATFDRMKEKVLLEEALTTATVELAGEDVHDRLIAIGREQQIEEILRELKLAKGKDVENAE
jgi:phage shock protein A